MVLAVVQGTLARVDVVDIRGVEGDVVVDLPEVAGVVILLLTRAAVEAEVDVGTPHPGIQAAAVQQGQ
ncbi:hypothetical protein D3C80_1866210 [compost metagenome]